MNNIQPVTTSKTLTNHLSKKEKAKKSLLIVLIMVLVGAFGYGSYIYGSKNSKNNAPLGQANTGAGTNKEDNQLNQTKDTTLTSYHTVGFGSLDRDPNILTKLAFPQNYQAIAFYNGPDSFRSLFGDDKGSFTYHGGNWKIGNPEDGVG